MEQGNRLKRWNSRLRCRDLPGALQILSLARRMFTLGLERCLFPFQSQTRKQKDKEFGFISEWLCWIYS